MSVRTDTGPFAMVPEWLLYGGVSGNAVKLFAILHRHEGAEGCHPGRQRLAALMGCSVDTVDRTLRELVDAGAVEINARRDAAGDATSNEYRLILRLPGRKDAATGMGTDAATGSRKDAAQTIAPRNESSLNEIPPTEGGAKAPTAPRSSRVVKPLTDGQREAIEREYADLDDARQQIALALSHDGARRHTDMNLYVRNWLRRERAWRAERGGRNGRDGTAGRNGAAGGRAGRAREPDPVYDFPVR